MPRLAALGLWAALSAVSFMTPAAAQDESSELLVRMNRLEGQVRQLSGQLEQLQFENRQFKENVRKFQEDVDFRFQDRGGGRSGAAAPAGQPSSQPARPVRRSDAFDPDAEPSAAGAPRPLGPSGASPSGRGRADTAFTEGEAAPRASASAPLDLNAAARGPLPGPAPASSRPAASEINPAGVSGLNPGLAGGNPAAGGGDAARVEYETAYGFIRDKQFDQAETSFRRFISSHPRDRLVPDATYWLGESFLQRNRPREAAELFLKVSTEHGRSPRAPDAMLKLGMALSALGARDQACATLAEVERKYPSASAGVKQGVDREQKRARCPG